MAAPAQFSTDHFALRLGLFYAAFFLFGGIQLPFFPVWLEARGLDPRTIGLVIAVPMLVRIVATPLITHQADRRQALKATLLIASAVGAFGMTVVGLAEGAMAILLAYVVTMAACSPVLSLTDAYALNGLPPRGRAYGPVRLWGSVAFIVGNVGAGLMLSVIAPGHLIWLIVGALVAAVIAAALLVPLDRSAPAGSAEPRASSLTLLRNPAFIAIAFASSLVQGSHAFYYGFSTLEWRASGFGGGTIGLLWGIGVAAEIALFALSGRLPERLHPAYLLVIGGVGAAIRWTAMAFEPPLLLLLLLQLLHACSFGAAHLGAMGFLARAIPRERAASAQGFIATLSGIVSASATGLSGLLYASYGGHAYLLMTAMALTGVVSALLAGRLSVGAAAVGR